MCMCCLYTRKIASLASKILVESKIIKIVKITAIFNPYKDFIFVEISKRKVTLNPAYIQSAFIVTYIIIGTSYRVFKKYF